MKCPKCRFENTDTAMYCSKCDFPLLSTKDIQISDTKTLQVSVGELTRGTTFAGRYEIIELLGRGGMGRVYRVLDKKLNEEIALKLINPEIAADEKTLERFNNELKFARKIIHKNVGRMYELMEDKGHRFITMEYVPGENLEELMRKVGPLSPKQVISITKQVCLGLAEAHKTGIIHRDLKPSNIMIDKDGHVRILDFGVARFTMTDGLTTQGKIIGTPAFMSPEQVGGETVDQRSDIYSLGIILYEMVTGRLPFKASTPVGLALKHKLEQPEDPRNLNPKIPFDLGSLILKCLEKDRENRYKDAEILLSELDKVNRKLMAQEKEVPLHKRLASETRKILFSIRKPVLPALIVMAVAVVFFIVWQTKIQRDTLPASSGKPALAVMYFKNNTGDESLDHWRTAFTDLLITDLSQSRYLRILSRERLYEILSRLGQLDAETYSSDILKEVAERAEIESVVVGNFVKANDVFRINVTLQDAHTGELIGSEVVEGTGEKDFFPLVDELTRRIKTIFELSEEKIAEDYDDDVQKITTSSPEAYKYYLEGVKNNARGNFQDSIVYLKKAVSIDPEFAMAYRTMSIAYSNMHLFSEQKKAIQKALEFSYRVSERERYLIQGRFYSLSEKTYDRAIAIHKELLELYHEEDTARANLGWLYLMLEEWDEAIEMYKPLVSENRYESAIPFWNLAEVYMAKGEYDIAKEVLENCLHYYPNSAHVYEVLTFIYICHEEYEKALAEVEKALSLGVKIEQAKLRGDIFLFRGDLTKSEQEYLKISEENSTRRLRLVALDLLKGRIEETKNLLEQSRTTEEKLTYIDGNTEIRKSYYRHTRKF